MSLIDQSYFVAELNIPSTSNAGVLERINFFIAKYEKDYLMKVLGVGCYNDFMTGLNATTVIEPWLSLKNGKDFNNLQGRLEHYFGLTNLDKKSPIANYVYYHYQRDAYTQTSSVGEVQSKAENATVVTPAYKMEAAWNDMVKQTNVLIEFLYVNNKDYPKFNLAFIPRELVTPINTFNL
jgi:hypothetical protein